MKNNTKMKYQLFSTKNPDTNVNTAKQRKNNNKNGIYYSILKIFFG